MDKGKISLNIAADHDIGGGYLSVTYYLLKENKVYEQNIGDNPEA